MQFLPGVLVLFSPWAILPTSFPNPVRHVSLSFAFLGSLASFLYCVTVYPRVWMYDCRTEMFNVDVVEVFPRVAIRWPVIEDVLWCP